MGMRSCCEFDVSSSVQRCSEPAGLLAVGTLPNQGKKLQEASSAVNCFSKVRPATVAAVPWIKAPDVIQIYYHQFFWGCKCVANQFVCGFAGFIHLA